MLLFYKHIENTVIIFSMFGLLYVVVKLSHDHILLRLRLYNNKERFS
jgi:hypothetical protein